MLILAMLNNNTTSQKSHYKLQIDDKFAFINRFKTNHENKTSDTDS